MCDAICAAEAQSPLRMHITDREKISGGGHVTTRYCTQETKLLIILQHFKVSKAKTSERIVRKKEGKVEERRKKTGDDDLLESKLNADVS